MDSFDIILMSKQISAVKRAFYVPARLEKERPTDGAAISGNILPFVLLFCSRGSTSYLCKVEAIELLLLGLQDARSDEGLAREVILYALLSIASPYPIWGSTEPSPVAANA